MAGRFFVDYRNKGLTLNLFQKTFQGRRISIPGQTEARLLRTGGKFIELFAVELGKGPC